MAWTPVLPSDPTVARWWHEAAEREEAAARAEAADRALVVPALAARVRRCLRDIDQALELSRAGQFDRRSVGPTPDHGVESRFAGPVEYGPGGRILSVR